VRPDSRAGDDEYGRQPQPCARIASTTVTLMQLLGRPFTGPSLPAETGEVAPSPDGEHDNREHHVPAGTMIVRVDALEAERLIAGGITVVDVLPAKTFQQEHLPGALNVPLEAFEPSHVASLDKAAALLVYCFDQH
jgi:hypothetical protein